jgi:nitrite reductase/ring-hydroxylating ferredoxin subunit
MSDPRRAEGDASRGEGGNGARTGSAPAPTPAVLAAPGSTGATFRPFLPAADLPPGALRRGTVGDLDVLLAHPGSGLVATDDRCPHMSAPLSLGRLDGCVVDCPLHRGRFDLCPGEAVQLPTTGGLDADGGTHAPWSPAGMEPRPEPPGAKVDARRLTRTRRLRFYPVRVVDGTIEVALPDEIV